MKMIAGLGNPGTEYTQTKHNVGFMLLDALAKHLEAPEWKTKRDALVTETRIGAGKALLVKPLTYMNDSGRAIEPLLAWYKLRPEDLIVAHDDMDIPVGMIRIRKKGSAGGHNGIKSVLYHVQDENFSRVRIGIGRPPVGWTVIKHVLTPFSPADRILIDEAIDRLVPAVECIVRDGVDLAMNRFNPVRQKKTPPEGV
ncbi:MAG: aminoacyl-tRNA hydrolase [Negativicutes bacterium]